LDPLLAQLLQLYDAEMARAFGFVEAPIVEALTWLNTQFGWRLDLHPHWKHLFVLTWLYFVSVAKGHLSENGDHVRALFPSRALGGTWAQGPLSKVAFVRMIWSLFVALISAVTAGTADLNGANATWLIPVCGLVGYTLVFAGIDAVLATQGTSLLRDSWSARFWSLFKGIPPRILVGSTLIVLGTQVRGLQLAKLPNGLVVLFAMVMLEALWNLGRGVWSGQGLPRRTTARRWRLGRGKTVPQISMNVAHSPRREWRAETIFFDRTADRVVEPSAVGPHRTGQVRLGDAQFGTLMVGVIIMLGVLVLFFRLFW
jgi:hypothetical protein